MTEMPDILQKICGAKREEIETLRCAGPRKLEQAAEQQGPPRGFRAALAAAPGVALIAEVKKASPSAGIIREDFDPGKIARAYVLGGATGISVLTETRFFQGSPAHLSRIRQEADVPLLRKDFILDEIQVLESRALGADAYLLIAAALEPELLRDLLARGHELGMDALIEVHDEQELEIALDAGADLVGINNRDLHTFQVSLEVTERLASLVPDGIVLVSESGITSRADVQRLQQCDIDAVLVGEHLMRADDIEAATRELSAS